MIECRIRSALALLLVAPLLGCGSHALPAAAPSIPAYAAVARGRVDVEGGLLNLGAPRDGELAQVDVQEGQLVRRGQVLAVLDERADRLAVQSAEAELAQARAQLTLLDARLAAANLLTRRLSAAARAGAGDGQSADDARASAQELQAQKQAALAGLALAGQKVTAARLVLSRGTLRAPIDADVIRVSAQPGTLVSPQAGPLFVLLPRSNRIVRAELSEAYVDAVTVGMRAQVSADGGTQTTPWQAHVIRLGELIGPSVLEEDPQQRTNSHTVECVLAFDSAPAPRVGQRVLVRFGTAAARPVPKGRETGS